MNFTKPMIDLVQEIRRRVPSEHKPEVKLANPELLYLLIPIYQQSSDAILKALLKELFHMAGDGWSAKLELNEVTKEKLVTKIYRGQVQLAPARSGQTSDKQETERPKKVYRGQVVA